MAKALKGCLNNTCKAYEKRELFKREYMYCPFCGEELNFVCKRCGMKLDNGDSKYCVRCENKIKDKKDKPVETIINAVADAAKDVGEFAANAGEKVVYAVKDGVADLKEKAKNDKDEDTETEVEDENTVE